MIDPALIHRPNVVIDENGQPRVQGMMTREEFDEAERIRNSQYFLVRNDGGEMGERLYCLRNKSQFDRGHLHAYFTLMCVERPWNGLEDGLRFWLKAASDGPRKSKILAGMDRGLEDYARTHPLTAGHLRPTDPNVLAWYSYLAGTHIPITVEKARQLAQKIKDRRPMIFPPELLTLFMPSIHV